MSEQEINYDDFVILVDFGGQESNSKQENNGGLEEIKRGSNQPEDIRQLSGKSKEAVENALGAIGWVAKKAKEAVSGLSIHEKPAQMELEFGIKISAEAGVVVAKGSTDLHITAKLIWKNND